mgnify:CR=1 FL=1
MPDLKKTVFSANRGDDYLRDFFIPALEDAVHYKRVTGDFSSAFLSVAADGLAPFFVENGKMQLVCNGRFTQADYEAIQRGVSMESVIESQLSDYIERRADLVSQFEKERLEVFALLLAEGRLEIRLSYVIDDHGAAVPVGMQKGMQHSKLGVIDRRKGEKIGFVGSLNESGMGYEGHLETLVARYSWVEGHAPEIQEYEEIFDILWNDTSPKSKVYRFPEACIRRLVEIYKPPKKTKAMEGVQRKPLVDWSHQDRAVEVFLEKKVGILRMATGTGKTRTALKIAATLLRQKKIDSIIISTFGNDLLRQWSRELHEFLPSLQGIERVYRQFEGEQQLGHYVLSQAGAALVCSREKLPQALRALERKERVLLIHDEVHGLGSAGNVAALGGLSEGIVYRLGLSATPEREYDSEGNKFIQREIGEVIFRFELEDAIKRGVLSPFTLFPLSYEPTANDKLEAHKIQKEMHARRNTATPMPVEEFAQRISRVYKLSPAKLPVFDSFIATNQQLLKRCLIFVEEKEYGEQVLELVHKYRRDFHSYFADDEASKLHDFARGDLECLVTCHKLSVGIDIKSVSSIILFASPRAKLETIQRIGRCLRRDPENPEKRSTIVDFYRSDVEPEDDQSSDIMRRNWLTQLSSISPENS